MGNIITNPLFLLVSVNSVLSKFLPLVFYYFIASKLSTSKMPIFLLESLIYAGVLWGVNILLSMNSSNSNCGNYNITSSMVSGLYPAICVFLAYYLIFLFPIFKRPLEGILENVQNKTLVNYIIIGFFMAIFSWTGSIMNHFTSVKNGCKMSSKSFKEFKEKMKKREEELEKEEEEEPKDKYVELK